MRYLKLFEYFTIKENYKHRFGSKTVAIYRMVSREKNKKRFGRFKKSPYI